MNKKIKKSLILAISLTLLLLTVPGILALESSPSADSPSDKVINKIKERLEKETVQIQQNIQ